MKKIGFLISFALLFIGMHSIQGQESNTLRIKQITQQKMEALSKLITLSDKAQKNSIEQLYIAHEKSILDILKNPQGEGLQHKIIGMETALDHKIMKLLTSSQKNELERHRGKQTTLDKH